MRLLFDDTLLKKIYTVCQRYRRYFSLIKSYLMLFELSENLKRFKSWLTDNAVMDILISFKF